MNPSWLTLRIDYYTLVPCGALHRSRLITAPNNQLLLNGYYYLHPGCYVFGIVYDTLARTATTGSCFRVSSNAVGLFSVRLLALTCLRCFRSIQVGRAGTELLYSIQVNIIVVETSGPTLSVAHPSGAEVPALWPPTRVTTFNNIVPLLTVEGRDKIRETIQQSLCSKWDKQNNQTNMTYEVLTDSSNMLQPFTRRGLIQWFCESCRHFRTIAKRIVSWMDGMVSSFSHNVYYFALGCYENGTVNGGPPKPETTEVPTCEATSSSFHCLHFRRCRFKCSKYILLKLRQSF